MRFVLGIDEAGRGPLAGPVAVASVKVEKSFNKKFWRGIRDSKQLTFEERELWFEIALEAKRALQLDFAVVLISESIIDKHGIVYAIELGIRKCLSKLSVSPEETQIFLDGGIKAPPRFEHQLTVIKGDEKIPVISLASIIAKVVRDRRMVKSSKAYPEFNFAKHKGYGTRAHFEVLQRLGPTAIHRLSFLKNFIKHAT